MSLFLFLARYEVLGKVCLPVCLSAHISQKPNYAKFSVYVACDYGLVFLWQHCDTYGSVDDVMFLRNGLYGAVCIPQQQQDSIVAETSASITIKLC